MARCWLVKVAKERNMSRSMVNNCFGVGGPSSLGRPGPAGGSIVQEAPVLVPSGVKTGISLSQRGSMIDGNSGLVKRPM